MFKDYEELEGWLIARKRKADMDAILSYLQNCVAEEAEILLEEELRQQNRVRRSKRLLEKCKKEAQEHYVEEVVEMLESIWAPSPWAVISYRRKPKVWAIAGAIQERIKYEDQQ